MSTHRIDDDRTDITIAFFRGPVPRKGEHVWVQRDGEQYPYRVTDVSYWVPDGGEASACVSVRPIAPKGDLRKPFGPRK